MINLPFPQRRRSSEVKSFWIPAFAGMTFLEVALRYNGGRDGESRTEERDLLGRGD